MTQFRIYLLGSPRFERNGVNINLDTRKASALIAYLAIAKQRQSRDSLAALLWPEFDETHARATLRRTLSTLNKALDGPYLEVSREYISLNFNAGIWIDVDEFHHLLSECRSHNHLPAETCSKCLEPLTTAVKLYGGDFLAGFSLRDSSTFDDWQFYQADSLRRDFTSTLERLVQCHSTSGNFESAITYAQQWLALDRLNESAHRLLMQLYAWNGQQSAALHQYRECVQVLERELGVGPLESTTRLYQAIKEHQISPSPATIDVSTKASETRMVHVSPSRMNTSIDAATTAQTFILQTNYPLVGRSHELSKLKQTYDDIHTVGCLMLLEGEAGIGKTRLAEEFLANAQSKGAIVISARCYEGETQFAFGPIVAGLQATLAEDAAEQRLKDILLPWLSEAARLLPELYTYRADIPLPLPLDSPGAQSRFFEGLKQMLYAICKGEVPGIIFFDDIQWADSATLDLLNYLVRRLREQPVCLLVTLRNKQASNDNRLHQLRNEALRAGNATIVSLSRLNLMSVRELVLSTSIHGEALNEGFIERLFQETEGLPFFLIEYLLAITNGVLSAESENWSPPGSVRELLHSRLKAVSETGRQLLGTAAVIGRSFDFDTLREVSGRTEEESVNALEELIAQGLVEEVDVSVSERALNYDFSHERLRSLVYEETSLARRRLLHRRVAEALIGHTRENRMFGMVAGQIAYHFEKSGNEALAAEYFKLAGDHARSLYANAEALTHYRMALALGYTDAANLHECIGDLYTLSGEYSNAIKSYETAAALCAPTALVKVEHKLGNVYERLGEWDLAESHYETTLHIFGQVGSEGERAKVYADWSLAAYHRGQIERAINLAKQALDLAEVAQDTRALAQVHNILGILASKQQRPEEAQHHLEQSLALAEELNDMSLRIAVLNNLALVCKSYGEIDRAIALTQDALALCESQGDLHREAALYSNLADLFHENGNAEAAMSYLKKSVSIFADIGEEVGTMRPEIWKLVEW
jgi:DNA-binding SARP family transcriptional activator/Tfp pilus assembly protein PilF